VNCSSHLTSLAAPQPQQVSAQYLSEFDGNGISDLASDMLARATKYIRVPKRL
jgi:hypothetical protein